MSSAYAPVTALIVSQPQRATQISEPGSRLPRWPNTARDSAMTGRAAPLARDADQADQAVRDERRDRRDDEGLPEVEVVRHDEARAHREQQHADVGPHPGGEESAGPGGAFVVGYRLDATGFQRAFARGRLAHGGGSVLAVGDEDVGLNARSEAGLIVV